MSEIAKWGLVVIITIMIQYLILSIGIMTIEDMIDDLKFKLDHKLISHGSKNGGRMNKWIPISEKLPDDGDDVLVTICKRGRKPYVMSAEYYKEFFRNEEIYEHAKSKDCIIKAWMIPEPYEAESENEINE